MKTEIRRRPYTATSTDTTDTTTVIIRRRLPFTRDVATVRTSRQELCAQIAETYGVSAEILERMPGNSETEILANARKLDRYKRKHATVDPKTQKGAYKCL